MKERDEGAPVPVKGTEPASNQVQKAVEKKPSVTSSFGPVLAFPNPIRSCVRCGAKAASKHKDAWVCEQGPLGGCGRDPSGWDEITFEERGDFFFEEILTWQGPRLVRYNWKSDQFGYEDEHRTQTYHYVPVIPEPALVRALTLAGGLREYGSTQTLLAEMEALAREVFDPGSEDPIFRMVIRGALASWVVGPLFEPSMEKFASIFAIIGPSESGKGRFLTVLRALCYRPMFFFKTTKIPSLFRGLDVWKGTLLLDEADEPKSDESSEYIEFLNARATGVPIPRFSTEAGKNQYFYSFGNTGLALRKPYEDDGFNSRAVKLRAESSKKNDIPLVPPAAWIQRTREIQEKLLLFRLRTISKIRRGELFLRPFLAVEGVKSFRVKEAFLVLDALSKDEPALMADAAEIGRELQARLVASKATSKEGRILNVVYSCLEDGWEIVAEGNGFRLETVRLVERDGMEDSQREVLRAGYVADQLDRSIAQKEIVAFWKGLQDVKEQARFGPNLEKRARSILLIRDPAELDRQFERFVPEFKPQGGKFHLGQPSPEREGAGGGTSVTAGTNGRKQTTLNEDPRGSVPLVPLVPGHTPSGGVE